MSNLNVLTQSYLDYCRRQKRLDEKTLKAYRIDLTQFLKKITVTDISEITPKELEQFIGTLHQKYKPKTVKRKIASLKALFHYFEYKEIVEQNPFSKLQLHFREPVILPKIIPLDTLETLLIMIYKQQQFAKTPYQKRNALRDAAIVELLFVTGMRISELCSLKRDSINLHNGTVLIYGKGNKERRVQIGNNSVIHILKKYKDNFIAEIENSGYFFTNQSGKVLSDQTVRRMINKYTALASIEQHITPHMFRHTFATSLLEADVDIRFIQEMLGHSSITVTEIYTHVAVAKQKDILTKKHPRKDFNINIDMDT